MFSPSRWFYDIRRSHRYSNHPQIGSYSVTQGNLCFSQSSKFEIFSNLVNLSVYTPLARTEIWTNSYSQATTFGDGSATLYYRSLLLYRYYSINSERLFCDNKLFLFAVMTSMILPQLSMVTAAFRNNYR